MVDVSEENRRRKLVRALILAAWDMEHAAYAAEAIRGPEGRDHRVRGLLETAMCVTYMRPFTSTIARLDGYRPIEGDDAALHEYLKHVRDKDHAHTDVVSPRRASFGITTTHPPEAGSNHWMGYVQQTTPFPTDLLPAVVDLCGRLKEIMLADARQAWIDLGRPSGDWY